MNEFVLAAEEGLWFLGEWSLRWGVLIGLLAVWFHIRAPRRSDVRYAIAWSVLLGGVCLPLAPRWGPGFWWSAAGSSSSTPNQPVREVSITAADAAIPERVAPTMAPLTYPPEYSRSPIEPDDRQAPGVASAEPIQEVAPTPVEATLAIAAGGGLAAAGGLLSVFYRPPKGV